MTVCTVVAKDAKKPFRLCIYLFIHFVARAGSLLVCTDFLVRVLSLLGPVFSDADSILVVWPRTPECAALNFRVV